jgi:hypothetical protein
MSKISWRQVSALALAAFFVVGSLSNIFAPGSKNRLSATNPVFARAGRSTFAVGAAIVKFHLLEGTEAEDHTLYCFANGVGKPCHL